jgi:hypothetical protein
MEMDKNFGFKGSGSLQKQLRKMRAEEKSREARSEKLSDEYVKRVNKSATKAESECIVIEAARMDEMNESDFLAVSRAHSIKWIVQLKKGNENGNKTA